MQEWDNKTPVLRVEDLRVHFPINQTLMEKVQKKEKESVKAVDGISFSIYEGKTLALVGESGCGKSTLGRTIVGLNKPVSGKIIYKGQDILKLKPNEMKTIRKEIQYIFQNPYASLNPKMTIKETVRRPLDIFNIGEPDKRDERVYELLEMTGIAKQQAMRYPHEFSGGQRQRICIARSLAMEPKLIIADEPTSALDVSIQCQILDLLTDLKTQLNLTMLFISHDLGVVNYISDDVVVMYLGHTVETGVTKEVFQNPAHPYSKALLDALPKRADIKHERGEKLTGYIPSPIHPPEGCLLSPRCAYASDLCFKSRPELVRIGEQRFAACHFCEKLD